MGAHGRHTRTTADEHHFVIGVFGEKLPKRPKHFNLIARLEAEGVGRHDARWNAFATGGRCGDANIKLHNAFLFRVVSHRVCALYGLFHHGFKLEETEPLPVAAKLLFDVGIFELDMMWRTLQLRSEERREGKV